jgi:hypothetical protein
MARIPELADTAALSDVYEPLAKSLSRRRINVKDWLFWAGPITCTKRFVAY